MNLHPHAGQSSRILIGMDFFPALILLRWQWMTYVCVCVCAMNTICCRNGLSSITFQCLLFGEKVDGAAGHYQTAHHRGFVCVCYSAELWDKTRTSANTDFIFPMIALASDPISSERAHTHTHSYIHTCMHLRLESKDEQLACMQEEAIDHR